MSTNTKTTNIGKNATTTKTGMIGLGTMTFLGIVFVLDIYAMYRSFRRESEGDSNSTFYICTGTLVFFYVFCLLPIISLMYSALHFINRPSGKSIGIMDIFLGANIVQTIRKPILFLFAMFYVFLLLPLLAFIL
jgi:uncharacterized membrane protein YhaH (DUF805 family)